ncbi:MAG TPA: FkbM family methyltransferase [Terriglobia bacterium]|nr:FkbM family methyltransferase [Terriglobia bacterium]
MRTSSYPGLLAEKSLLYAKTLLTAKDAKSLYRALLVKLEDEVLVERLRRPRRIGAGKQTVVNFDISFYCDNHTVSMYYEIFGATAYSFFPTFVPQDGDIVVDIGANQGIFTCYAAKRAPRGWVYAVEPDVENLSRLKAHLELNRISNVTVIPKCVGDRASKACFRKGDSSGTGYVVDVGEQGPGFTEVDQITLEEMMTTYQLPKIDLLKIDVEGFEAKVLSGADGRLASIRRIVLEYHSPMLANEVAGILKDKGFRLLPNPGPVRSHILYFENSALCGGQ